MNSLCLPIGQFVKNLTVSVQLSYIALYLLLVTSNDIIDESTNI